MVAQFAVFDAVGKRVAAQESNQESARPAVAQVVAALDVSGERVLDAARDAVGPLLSPRS